jgi:VanZ family protein
VTNAQQTLNRVLGLTPLLVLCCILTVGLWPFHAPKNEVSWLSRKNGLLFGKYGTIVSAGPFKARSMGGEDSCSLEIWLEPKRARSSGTILAFYWPESHAVPFALGQSLSDLLLQRSTSDGPHHTRRVRLYVDEAFNQRKPILFTISSSRAATAVYADGKFVKRSASLGLSREDLTGRLVVGNSPVTTDVWSGQLRGLAIYDHELTSDEVSQHYASWTSEHPDLAGNEGVLALYLFNEGSGNVVHNQVDPSTDLLIRERFFVLHKQFLERPWDEFYPGWNYWKDIAVNILGFVPLGFSFRALLFSLQKVRRPVLAVIAFGFAVSLTIEVLQGFLPTRDSGMTDLFTNTLGTALGALAFSILAIRFIRSCGPRPERR